MRRRLGQIAACGLSFVAMGCTPEAGQSDQFNTDDVNRVRIVEVGATSRGTAFLELRNDGREERDLTGWSLERDGSRSQLEPLAIVGDLAAHRDATSTVDPGELALIFDADVDPAQATMLACAAPIATTPAALGDDHAAPDDPLGSTLALQALRRCRPVLLVEGLEELLRAPVALASPSGVEEQLRIDDLPGPGLTFERVGAGAGDFTPGPLGASPGARNFYAAEAASLSVLWSSPWRVGDAILDLERHAQQLLAQGDEESAKALQAEAEGLRNGGHLPNPLVTPLVELIASSERRIDASFFQINDPEVISALVEAARRGVTIRLTSDAQFADHPDYVQALAQLKEAGIEVVMDSVEGRDRGPLSHNKFAVVDGAQVWTGSYNPIEDDPARIHADNVLRLEHRAAAALHESEIDTLHSGLFGTDKRDHGLAGGTFHVDGAEISLRFSPGLTPGQLKYRGAELEATGDPLAACDVRYGNGNPVVQERYRSLFPCGGPFDLITAEVARATSSLYFVAFSLSLDEVADLMVERRAAGVDVRGVVDPTVSTIGVAKRLLADGADVRYTPNSNPECPDYISPKTLCPTNPNKVWLHHKFVLVDYGTDHASVITGSHNLSDSAERSNDESLLVIRDRAVVERYYRIFREAYDHPQTMGERRSAEGLPALAITEVAPAADALAPQWLEIANFGEEAATLDGLELWTRRQVIPLSGELPPDGRLVVTAGEVPGLAAGVPVLQIEIDPEAPVLAPDTALVLRHGDGRWIASYDPVLSADHQPATWTEPGAAYRLAGVDQAWLDAEMVALLGVDQTPEAAVPTWSPRGFFSDWPDEHHVTPTVLLLQRAAQPESWMPVDVEETTPGW